MWIRQTSSLQRWRNEPDSKSDFICQQLGNYSSCACQEECWDDSKTWANIHTSECEFYVNTDILKLCASQCKGLFCCTERFGAGWNISPHQKNNSSIKQDSTWSFIFLLRSLIQQTLTVLYPMKCTAECGQMLNVKNQRRVEWVTDLCATSSGLRRKRNQVWNANPRSRQNTLSDIKLSKVKRLLATHSGTA